MLKTTTIMTLAILKVTSVMAAEVSNEQLIEDSLQALPADLRDAAAIIRFDDGSRTS